MAKLFSANYPQNQFSASVSTFNSAWDGSGQIPFISIPSLTVNKYNLNVRNDGAFGSLDSSEGGNTQRTNVIVNLTHEIDSTSSLKSTVFFSNYGFELWSNFLFYNDTINGSAIHQVDRRSIYGMDHNYTKRFHLGRGTLKLVAGAYLRMDNIDKLFLGQVVNRYTPIDSLSYGSGTETNIALYAGLQYHIGKFSIHPGIRLDYFNYNFVNILRQLDTAQTPPTQGRGFLGAIVARPSYKLNMYYQASKKTQIFLKLGTGFHSNDMRSVLGIGRNTEEANPQNRGPQFSRAIPYTSYKELLKNALPLFANADLGLVFRPAKGLFINPSLWASYFQNETVWSGDSYGVDAVGETYRWGLDLAVRYQPVSWVYFDLDANFAQPRLLTDEDGKKAEKGHNYLDLAPIFTSTAGISVKLPFGLSSSLRYRWMADRPGDQDNHFTVPGYFVNDLLIQYQRRHWLINMSIQNLFNVRWYEAMFVTEDMGLKLNQGGSSSNIAKSQDEARPNQAYLSNDAKLTKNGIQTGITDLAVTPGTPIYIKLAFAYTW